MFRLTDFRRRTRAFSEYLRYAFPVGDGIVRLKGNGWLRAYALRGPDLAVSSWDELAARGERFGGLLRNLDDQWSIHVDAFRIPSRAYPKDGAWPDRLTRLLDQDRRWRYEAEGRHFETRYVLSLAYAPRRARSSRLARLLHDAPMLEAGSDEAAEATFRARTDELAAGAAHLFYEFAPLGTLATRNGAGRIVLYDEMLAFLGLCVRGRAHPIALVPDEPMFLDGVIGADDVRTGWDLRVGEQWVGVLALEGYPGYSYPGILDALAQQPCAYRWNQRFIPMSRRQADERLGWLAKGWGLASLGGIGLLTGGVLAGRDRVAAAYKEQVLEARDRAKDGLTFGHYNATVLLHAPDRASRDAGIAQLRTAIEQVEGFAVRVETENAMEAFLASLPGERDANEYREARVSVRNAAHFFPMTATWAGPTTHPHPRFGAAPPLLWTTTTGATPFRLCLHEGEVGHTLVVGTTGGGKSALLMRLISAHFARYRGARAWMFDVGYSAYKYALGIGGAHYVIGAEGGLRLAPLSGADTETGLREVLAWLTELYEIRTPLTIAQRRELEDALVTLVRVKPQASLSDLAIAVQNEELRAVLREYAGSFLDGASDALDFGAAEARGHVPFFVFEYEPLGTTNVRFTTPFIQYVRRRINESLNDDGDEPALVVFDEGHRALSIPKLEAFGEDLVRTGRKKLTQFIFATTDPTDVVDSAIAAVLINLTPTKILLPNAAALTERNRAAYRALGLTDEEIALLAQMEPFTYLCKHPRGTRVFSLEFSAFELAILAGASRADKARVDATIAEGGYVGWPARYLRRLGDAALETYAQAYEALGREVVA